jgi:RHS repeat-associated protein
MRQYELSGHLGKVRAVIGNRLKTETAYAPKLLSATDYFPFGMQMPGRVFSSPEGYRYGFNGMEKENAVNEVGYDFGARLYNSWNGKFLSIDPYSAKFPSESNYIFAGNNPVYFIDVKGKFKFSAATLRKLEQDYPIAFNYLVQTDINRSGNIMEMTNSDKIIESMIFHSFNENPDLTNLQGSNLKLSKEKIQASFLYGGGPEIIFTKEPGGSDMAGGYNEKVNSLPHGSNWDSPLQINEKLLINLQNAPDQAAREAALLSLVSTIIHEYMEDFSDDVIDRTFDETTNSYKEIGIYQMQRDIWGGFRPGYPSDDCAKDAIKVRSKDGSDPDPSVLPTLPN